jgi:hypothetical protein
MRIRLLVLALVVLAFLAVGLDRAATLAGDTRTTTPAPSTTLAEPAYTPMPAGFPDEEATERK